jgi:hypothetical protein
VKKVPGRELAMVRENPRETISNRRIEIRYSKNEGGGKGGVVDLQRAGFCNPGYSLI